MKHYLHTITKIEVEQQVCGSLTAGHLLLQRLRRVGVPVIGRAYPLSVAQGALTLSYDETFESFSLEWDSEAVRPESLDVPWFSMTYEHDTNPTHLAHALRKNLEHIGAVPIGASWVMAVEGSRLRSTYDEAFNEIVFWLEAA